MKRTLLICAVAASMAFAAPAQAGNGGAVAAGIVGGLAVGTILGAAAAQPLNWWKFLRMPPFSPVQSQKWVSSSR